MTLPYIRRTYNVPAFRGQTVRWDGKLGRILSARGPHLHVQLDPGPKVILHPTDGVEYLGRELEPMAVPRQSELQVGQPVEAKVPSHLADVYDLPPEAFGLPRGTRRRAVPGSSHVERTHNYLRRYGTVTQREAAFHYGDWRLADSVYRLRRTVGVLKETVEVPTRYGHVARIARYSLELQGGAH